MGQADGPTLDADGFLASLRAALRAPGRHHPTHPVVEAIVTGTLPRRALKDWVIQQYLFTLTTPRLIALRFAQCTDPEIRAHLYEVIEEEFAGRHTHTDNHVRLHARTALALGATEAELAAAVPQPETQALIYWQELVVRARPWFVALASKIGDEGQFSEACQRIVPGLRRYYGLDEDAITFYAAHVEADAAHGALYEGIVRRYASIPALQAEMREATLTTAELFWNMWHAAAFREPRKAVTAPASQVGRR